MPSPSRKADWPIIAGVILALVVVALGAYFGGYFLRSEIRPTYDYDVGTHGGREFATEWEALIFEPAAMVESLVRREVVRTYTPYDG